MVFMIAELIFILLGMRDDLTFVVIHNQAW